MIICVEIWVSGIFTRRCRKFCVQNPTRVGYSIPTCVKCRPNWCFPSPDRLKQELVEHWKLAVVFYDSKNPSRRFRLSQNCILFSKGSEIIVGVVFRSRNFGCWLVFASMGSHRSITFSPSVMSGLLKIEKCATVLKVLSYDFPHGVLPYARCIPMNCKICPHTRHDFGKLVLFVFWFECWVVFRVIHKVYQVVHMGWAYFEIRYFRSRLDHMRIH